MRDVLTGLAAIVVIALFGALIAPRFVDWDSRRTDIAARVSAILGVPVRIDGPISVTLLPTPAFKFGMVQVGDGTTRATIGRIKAELALPPLMKGEFQLTSIFIDGADVTAVSLDQPRVLSVPALDRFAELSIGKLTIANSRLRLVPGDGQAETVLRDIAGEATATSLLGPWRGNIGFWQGEDHLVLRFSTVKPEGTAMRLRVVAESDTRSSRAEYDGRVDIGTGKIVLDGAVTASGHMTLPLKDGPSHSLWRLQGKLKGERLAATLDDIQLSIGAPERQVAFTGAADLKLEAALAINATLSTRQVDLDRALASDNQEPTAPQMLLSRIKGSTEPTALPLVMNLDISAGKVMLGGDVIAGPRLVAQWRDGEVLVNQLEAELPGRTKLSFATVETASTQGRLLLSSQEPQRLAQWFSGQTGPLPRSGKLEVSGLTKLSSDRITMSEATVLLDKAALSGELDLDLSGPTPRINAKLKGSGLDLVHLPATSGEGSPIEADVSLDLDKVSFAGVGAGSIRARLWHKANELRIEALDIRDLGGASLSAKGSITPTRRELTGRLEGTQLEAMSALLTRLVPHPMMTTLGERLKMQVPVALELASNSAPNGDERFAMRGKLGGLDVDATLRLDRAGALLGQDGLALTVSAPSPEPIARLIGLEAIAVASAGPARLSFTASGPSTLGDGSFGLDADLAGTRINADGKWNGSEWTANGRFALYSRDLAPLAQSLLITVPAVPPGFALKAHSELDIRNLRITLRDLNAVAGGQTVSGELGFNLREFGRVSGQIKTGNVDAAAIAPLIFGVNADEAGRSNWSTSPFGKVAEITLPGDLWIEADTAHLGEGVNIIRPRFVLRFETGLVYLEHASGEWHGGTVAARATLRRADKIVALSGDVQLTSVEASRVFAEPQIQGRVSAAVELSGSGPSVASLVSSLAGTGSVTGHNVVLPRIRSGLLQGLIDETRIEGAELSSPALAKRAEEKLRAVSATGMSGSAGKGLALAAQAVPLSIAAGTVRVGPMAVPSGDEHIDAGLQIDIPRQTLAGQATFTARQNPVGWTGPPPRMIIGWRKQASATRHDIDTASLSSGLMAIAIQREQDRITAIEQDQTERGMFNRRLRLNEQERSLREEAARSSREEAARRAQEELARRRPVPAAPPSMPPPLVITPRF